ncbi:MAG: PilN domain-containing protein [Candidatus Omnitrophota bacterium]
MNKEITKTIVIPRHLAFIRFLDIPSVDDSEIKDVLRFQAIKELPYPKEDIVIGYKKLGSYKQGSISIMLVVATKEILEDAIENEARLGAGQDCIVRLYTELLYEFLLKQNVIKEDKVNLVINIGEKSSEIIVMDKKRLIVSRGFSDNKRLLEEIKHSLLAYKRDRLNPPIENIIIRRFLSRDTEDIKLYIEEEFQGVPLESYEFKKDLEALDFSLDINLAPEEIRQNLEKTKKKKESIIIYGLIFAIIALVFSLLNYKLYEKRKFIDILSDRLTKLQTKTHNLSKLSKKTDFLSKQELEGLVMVDILGYSDRAVPSSIFLSGLEYAGNNEVSYRGFAKDTSSVLDLVRILEDSEYFNKAEVKYATKKRYRGKEIVDFDIQCHIDMDNVSKKYNIDIIKER